MVNMDITTVIGIVIVILGGGIGVTIIKVAFDMGKLVEKVGNIEKFTSNHYTEIKEELRITRDSFTKTTDALSVQVGEIKGVVNAWVGRNGK